MARTPDGLQHRRVELITIVQNRDLIVFDEVGARRADDRVAEFVRMNREIRLKTLSRSAFRCRHQICHQGRCRKSDSRLIVVVPARGGRGHRPEPPRPEEFSRQAEKSRLAGGLLL